MNKAPWLLLAMALACSDASEKFPTKAENTAAQCQDGKDNDGDGFTDCDDQNCQVLPVCKTKKDGGAPPDGPGKVDQKVGKDGGKQPDQKVTLDQKVTPDQKMKPDQKLVPDLSPKPDQTVPDKGPAGCKSNKECSDGISCTADICTAGKCSNLLLAGFCLLGNKCVKNGAVNPAHVCERCDTSASTLAWSKTPACVFTLAGTGAAGYKDGPVLAAQFEVSYSVAVNSAGMVVIGDTLNRRVRAISAGKVTTLAGNGTLGFANGAAAKAMFNGIRGIEIDNSGKVYVGDYKNYRVRLVSGGQVTTFAGSGATGFADGAASAAQFSRVFAVATDTAGKLYVADGDNNRIRVVSGGKVTTLAGSGKKGFTDGPAASAKFDLPTGVAVDKSGNVYVADYFNNRIRKISGGKVTTLAGTGYTGLLDGAAANATFSNPIGVEVDGSGNVLVADLGNNRVRKVSAGLVTTYAGSTAGFADGPAATAKFNGLSDIAMGPKGNLYVTDYKNYRVRLVTPP